MSSETLAKHPVNNRVLHYFTTFDFWKYSILWTRWENFDYKLDIYCFIMTSPWSFTTRFLVVSRYQMA